MTAFHLFGKKPATRLTQAIFYIAWLSMLPDFFDARLRVVSWMNISMPLLLLAFLSTGLFSLLAGKDSLIDFWRSDSRLGRELSDPVRGPIVVRSLRVIGACFIAGSVYAGYTIIHLSLANNVSHTTGT